MFAKVRLLSNHALQFALAAVAGLFILAATTDSSAADGQININTASVSELNTLKGIGPAKAKAIIAYRDANGPFATVDDLTKVKGIGKKTLEKIRANITVGGTAAAPAQAPAAPAAPAQAPAAPAASGGDINL